MKRIFIISLLGLSSLCHSQSSIIVNDSAQFGFNFPKIKLLSNDVPYVIFGKPGNPAKLFGSRLVGANFNTPIELTPDSMQPRIGLSDGPDLVTMGDSIYAVWSNENSSNHHVFISKSVDAGNSYSTPIQVDSIFTSTGTNNIEYPGISISNTGDLGIYFIKSGVGFVNPKQTLITSTDRGQTFSIDSVVNSAAPGRACECCQASMEMDDTTYVFYYRNNDNNIRNAYNLVSFNNGKTFDEFYELDTLGWNINFCPSSGPTGYLNNNFSFTAWMTGASGNRRILFNSVDIITQATNDPDFIDNSVPSFVTQDFPSVDGSGDTVVVAWEDNRYILKHIFTAISFDGGVTFNGTTLISDTSLNGSFYSPDVVFKNGYAHFVWRSSSAVHYRKMYLSSILSVNENSITEVDINIFPNPTGNVLNISSAKQIIAYSIFDASGKLVKRENNPSNTIALDRLNKGIYFIMLSDGNNIVRKKFIKM